MRSGFRTKLPLLLAADQTGASISSSASGAGSFRDCLSLEFDRRRARNPSYSMRAFARSLGISPASLSRILRGEQGISLKLSERLGKILGLESTEIQNLSRGRVQGAERAVTDQDLQVISEQLGIPRQSVLEVYDRLIALGLLEAPR